MEFKIGAALACVGIAVGIAQWLVPHDTISYEVRFALVVIALFFGFTGVGILIHAAYRYFAPKLQDVPPVEAFGFADGSPSLQINFDGEADARFASEVHPVFGSDMVSYKFYGVRIANAGNIDAKDVSLEVEKIEEIADRPGELLNALSYLGLKFRFKTDAVLKMHFPPHFSDRVSLLSHANAMLLSENIRMNDTLRYTFQHHYRRHRLYVKATGSGVQPVYRTFLVWVNTSGMLTMVAEYFLWMMRLFRRWLVFATPLNGFTNLS